MPYVVSLVGFSPPPRYNGTPWTHVQVEESATPDGTFAQIDDQVLTPGDPDPTAPAARNVTTENATLSDGWYRLVFVDASGALARSDAVRYGGATDELPPSPDEIRARSPLLAREYPASPVSPTAERALRDVVEGATAAVQSLTGRILDPDHPENAASAYVDTMEDTPPGLVPIAFRAVTLMAEQFAVTSEVKMARQRAGRLRLRGFTAGPYSEQYWDPAMVRGASAKRPQFVDDPDLDDALWALATIEAQERLAEETTGIMRPAGQAQPFDFNRQPGIGPGFGGGGPLGPTGFGGGRGPDGF